MPVYDYKYLLQSASANTTCKVTTNEINFGVTYPGLNKAGKFGMHVVVTTTFAGATEGVYFWIIQGSAGSLASTDTVHTGMYVPLAQLIAGAHFFIPMGSATQLQYAVGVFSPASTAASAGASTIYFGDAEPTDVH